jgi:hypothetical protein
LHKKRKPKKSSNSPPRSFQRRVQRKMPMMSISEKKAVLNTTKINYKRGNMVGLSKITKAKNQGEK